MRTLHPALRVADLAAAVRFYAALGYTEVGRVPGSPLGELVLLRLPDDEFAALELVDAPPDRRGTSGLDHLAVQVESLDAAVAALRDAGYAPGEAGLPGGATGPRTAEVADPDGNRVELVEWPAGHPRGLTEEDFAPPLP